MKEFILTNGTVFMSEKLLYFLSVNATADFYALCKYIPRFFGGTPLQTYTFAILEFKISHIFKACWVDLLCY